MSRRLVSCVRPDRISSPMINTAAVTRSSLPESAIAPRLSCFPVFHPAFLGMLEALTGHGRLEPGVPARSRTGLRPAAARRAFTLAPGLAGTPGKLAHMDLRRRLAMA